jgi:sugar (pentulose or hexulose) kinase
MDQFAGTLLGMTTTNMKLMTENLCGYTYRAALEGITFVLKIALSQLQEACSGGDGKEGFCPNEIMVIGGGTKNKFGDK